MGVEGPPRPRPQEPRTDNTPNSPAKSRRVTPLCRTNSSGKDIPDAAAYLRNRNPSLPGYRQFTGNSAVSAGVSVRFTQERLKRR